MAPYGKVARLAAALYFSAIMSPAQVQFERDVLPLIQKHCLRCHGEVSQMGGLDLRTPATMLKGGSKGPALAKGSAENSLLYQRIVNKSMPMGDPKLADSEARVIREWIDRGALAGALDQAPARESQKKQHWAFRPLSVTAAPKVTGRAGTPVDAFLLSDLEKRDLRPAPPADRLTLLRRVYLDLVGLPPTPEEQTAFEKDRSSGAYERTVEALLSRPQYGERWARHWLDVVRYAESNGYERDGPKPSAWRYRDYVIGSFNHDKPYDRFLTEQLAGDEIEGSNSESQVGTAFLRLGTWDDEPAELVKDRYDQLDDVLGTTASVFLAQTLRCARCHDHKYEPFTQKDYYRVLAVFEPLQRPETPRKYNKFGVLVAHPKELDRITGTTQELAAYNEATAKADAAVLLLEKQIDEVTNDLTKRLLANKEKLRSTTGPDWLEHVETVLAFRADPDRLTKEQKELVEKFNSRLEQESLKLATENEKSQLARWKKEIAEINAGRPKEPPRAYVWEEAGPTAPVTHGA
jgi:hypothetical protein